MKSCVQIFKLICRIFASTGSSIALVQGCQTQNLQAGCSPWILFFWPARLPEDTRNWEMWPNIESGAHWALSLAMSMTWCCWTWTCFSRPLASAVIAVLVTVTAVMLWAEFDLQEALCSGSSPGPQMSLTPLP